jgi:hypothetical protein
MSGIGSNSTAEEIAAKEAQERELKEAQVGDLVGRALLTVKIRQPSHEFTFGVGMNFILYPLVLTPVV